MKELAGGKRKRDLKRAFALVDRAGTVNCLIAASDREYLNWVSYLREAIAVYSSKGPNKEGLTSELPENDSTYQQTTGYDIDRSAHGRPFGKSISRAIRVAKASGRVAKATGRAVVERGRRRSEDDIDTVSVESSEETEGTNQNDEAFTRGRQLRNRFAGVGQATKSRFGSAIQAAKEKGKKVAEKGKVAAQKRRAGRLDRSYEEAPETDSELNHDDAGNSTITCSRCTFLNAAGAVICSMCQSPLLEESPGDESLITLKIDSTTADDVLQKSPFDESVVVDDDIAGTQSEELGEIAENEMPRTRMRERLGNAVRNVRRGESSSGENDTSAPGDSSRHSLNLRLRNSMDRIEKTDTSQVHVGGAVKFRNISVAGPLPLSVDPFNLPFERAEIPLKQLHGCWYTKVAVSKTNQAINSSIQTHVIAGLDSPSTVEELTADTSGQIENVASSELADESSSLHERENSGATYAVQMKSSQDYPKKTVPSYIFEIQVHQLVGNESGRRSGSTKEITKTVPDMLALHSVMSECVGLLASAPKVPIEKAQVLTGDMDNSAAAMLGLGAFETVRFTGGLLRSLVESATNDDSAMSLDETCKFLHHSFVFHIFTLF